MSVPHSVSAARESSLALSNAVKLSLSLAAMLVVAMAVRLWLPRVLGPSGFGQLHFAESLALGLFLFSTLGADVYIRKEVATRPAHGSEFLGGLLLVRAAVSLIIFGAMAITLSLMGKGSVEWRLAFLFGVGQVAFVLETTLSAFLHAAGTVNALSIITASTKIIWGVAIVVGVTLGGGVEVVALTFVATEWTKAVVLFFLVRRSTMLELRIDLRATLAMMTASLPFFLHFLAHRVYERVDVQMLSVMTNDREVGWYGASVNIATLGMVFLPVLSAVILPMGARLVNESVAALNEMMKGALRHIIAVGALSSLLLILHAKDVVVVAFGPEFAPSVLSLQILAPIFSLTYICVVAGTHLVQLERVWTVTRISLIGLFLNPTLNYFAIPWFANTFGDGGAGAGAAAASLVTEIWASAAMLMALGSAAVDRRIASALARVALITAVTLGCHLLLTRLGLWSVVVEVPVFVASGTLLGVIPLGDIVRRTRAMVLRR